VIADNKLALNATWDEDILSSELADLSLDGFDLSLTGFSLGDLKGLGKVVLASRATQRGKRFLV
jgi:hypothetical protein